MTNQTAEIARSFVAALRKERDKTHVINLVIVDSDFFAIHRHFFTHPGDRGCVVTDVRRVADGGVAEHWDVVQRVPETILHANTMWCGQGNDFETARAHSAPIPRGGWPDPDADAAASRAVVDAYRAELDRDVRGAIERWLAPNYMQHSPHIPDGAEAAIAYFLPRVDKPKPHVPYSRVIAQGDLVLYHRRVVRPAGPPEGRMQVDIFRVTDGRISEHWDVMHGA